MKRSEIYPVGARTTPTTFEVLAWQDMRGAILRFMLERPSPRHGFRIASTYELVNLFGVSARNRISELDRMGLVYDDAGAGRCRIKFFRWRKRGSREWLYQARLIPDLPAGPRTAVAVVSQGKTPGTEAAKQSTGAQMKLFDPGVRGSMT